MEPVEMFNATVTVSPPVTSRVVEDRVSPFTVTVSVSDLMKLGEPPTSWGTGPAQAFGVTSWSSFAHSRWKRPCGASATVSPGIVTVTTTGMVFPLPSPPLTPQLVRLNSKTRRKNPARHGERRRDLDGGWGICPPGLYVFTHAGGEQAVET